MLGGGGGGGGDGGGCQHYHSAGLKLRCKTTIAACIRSQGTCAFSDKQPRQLRSMIDLGFLIGALFLPTQVASG